VTRGATSSLPHAYGHAVALHLREGTQLEEAASRLRQCAVEGKNIQGSSPGQEVQIHAHVYLNWISAVEAQLRGIYTDPEVLSHTRSAAYWAIRNPTFHDFRAIELINTEATEQAIWLEMLAGHLTRIHDRLVGATLFAVVDTNVLLHYKPPEQIDWAGVLGVDEARLVLALRVIEELDEKKYAARRDDLADRARRLLTQLCARLEPTGGGPATLRDKITIEVPIDDGPRIRPLDADQEVLDACEDLRNVGQQVVLVTGDTGMSLRAVARHLKVVRLSDDYLRNQPATPGSSSS
jgi:hypothetical protein